MQKLRYLVHAWLLLLSLVCEEPHEVSVTPSSVADDLSPTWLSRKPADGGDSRKRAPLGDNRIADVSSNHTLPTSSHL